MAFPGLRVVLVAKFNQRYHRTGGAIARAIGDLGCEVATCEERTGTLDRFLGRTLERRLGRVINRHRPDVVLVFKGAGLEPEAIERLKPAARARWFNWFPDSPHLLDLSLRIGRGYDVVFAFDSSMVARHVALGRDARYLAEGCEPAFHRPLPDPRWPRAAIAFVGSREPGRAAALESVADLGLRVWGPDWPAGPLYGDHFIKAFSNADLALNVHQFFGEPAERGWYGTGANRRVFELAAIGTVQLCDAKTDIARNFTNGREIVLFRSPDELRSLARDLLGDPARRAALAAAARQRALAEHTWGHRLTEMLSETLR